MTVACGMLKADTLFWFDQTVCKQSYGNKKKKARDTLETRIPRLQQALGTETSQKSINIININPLYIKFVTLWYN